MRFRGTFFLLFLATLLWAASGCGNGGGGGTAPPRTIAETPVLVNIGDVPEDRVVSLELTVESVTLVGSGSEASLLSQPRRLEITRLSGTFEPLVLDDALPGTYTQVRIRVSNPEVSLIDAGGQLVEAPTTLAQDTAAVSINLNLGTTPVVLNLDFDLLASLVIDGSNNVTVTPIFTASVVTLPAPAEQEEDSGAVDDVLGRVTAVSGSSFTIATDAGASLTFATNADTEFDGVTGVGDLQNGMVVEVDAVTQSGGTLLATEVEIENELPDDLEVEGTIVSVTGLPATSFTMAVQERQFPAGVSAPDVGSLLTVNIDSNTQFSVDDDDVDRSGLVTSFGAGTIAPVQKVEAETNTPDAAVITAEKVKLKEQGLTGTVVSIVQVNDRSEIVVAVDNDSAFARLTGQTQFTAVRQPSTRVEGTVSGGQTIRVRGLLFFNGTTYTLVAERIDQP